MYLYIYLYTSDKTSASSTFLKTCLRVVFGIRWTNLENYKQMMKSMHMLFYYVILRLDLKPSSDSRNKVWKYANRKLNNFYKNKNLFPLHCEKKHTQLSTYSPNLDRYCLGITIVLSKVPDCTVFTPYYIEIRIYRWWIFLKLQSSCSKFCILNIFLKWLQGVGHMMW